MKLRTKSKFNHIVKLACCFAIMGALPVGATVLTSFENAEGFTTLGVSGTYAGWKLASPWVVENSLAYQGTQGIVATNTSNVVDHVFTTAEIAAHYSTLATEFTTSSAFTSSGRIAWMYAFTDAQALQTTVTFGTTANSYKLTYRYGSATSTSVTIPVGVITNISQWNNLAIAFDYTADTASILVNNVTVVSNIAIDSSASTINRIWLAGPGAGITTDYDYVTAIAAAVPEPVSLSLLMSAGIFLLIAKKHFSKISV